MVSPETPQPAALSGQALVRLRDGSAIVGLVTIAGQLVTIDDGRLRVVSMVGGERTVRYRPVPRRTVSSYRVDQIVWNDDASVA